MLCRARGHAATRWREQAVFPQPDRCRLAAQNTGFPQAFKKPSSFAGEFLPSFRKIPSARGIQGAEGGRTCARWGVGSRHRHGTTRNPQSHGGRRVAARRRSGSRLGRGVGERRGRPCRCRMRGSGRRARHPLRRGRTHQSDGYLAAGGPGYRRWAARPRCAHGALFPRQLSGEQGDHPADPHLHLPTER